MPPDTDFDRMPDAKRHRYWRFDPTVSTGTLLQLGAIVVGVLTAYTALDKAQLTQQLRLEQVEQDAADESLRVKESLAEIKSDLKDVQRTLNDVSQSLATMKGRQP